VSLKRNTVDLGGYKCKIIGGGSKPGYCTIQINTWIAEKSYYNVTQGTVKFPYYASVANIGQ